MTKLAINTISLLRRRAYTVAAENGRKVAAAASEASAKRNTVESRSVGKEAPGAQKDVFWMRDPKTGYWIPETHFSDVDVAELRAKFIGNRQQTQTAKT